MKKRIANFIILYCMMAVTIALVLSSCATKVHCDAYGKADYSQNTDLATK